MAKTEMQVREQVTSLRQFLGADVVRAQIAAACPKSLTVDRVLRSVFTLVQTNMQLLECTPQSIMKGIIQASELGLELSGVMGQAYLVPRWSSKARAKEATFQLGYKGMITLAYRSSQIASFRMKSVRSNDFFHFEEGSKPWIQHRWERGPRGELTDVYAVAHMVNGGVDFEVMSLEEVQAHRQRYSPAPEGKPDYSAWATNFEAMAQKTVARRLAKRLPASVELQEAVGLDEHHEAGVDDRPAPGNRHEGLAARLAGQAEIQEELPDPDSEGESAAE